MCFPNLAETNHKNPQKHSENLIMRPKYLGCPVVAMKVDTSAYLRFFPSNTLIWVNSFCLDSVLTKQYFSSHLTFLWAYEIDRKRWYLLGLRHFWSSCFDPADFALCSKEIYIFTVIYFYLNYICLSTTVCTYTVDDIYIYIHIHTDIYVHT